MSRRDLCTTAVVAITTAVLLSGCGGGSDRASGPTTPTTPAAGQDTPASPPASPASAAATASAAPRSSAGSGAERSSKAKLDAYVASGRRQLKALTSDAMRQAYSDIRVEPRYPSGIEFVYVYRKPVDVPTAVEHLEASVPVLQATFDTQMAPEMKGQGLHRPSATWTYLNPDGSRIWSRTVS